ncbi:MAG: glycosyltransferase [Microbacteriaceae bacterium]|nr:glycosyltransferase [Microbacteriaceae bacterium]
MKFVVVSRTLKSDSPTDTRTSSQGYELGLAESLSTFGRTAIVSLSAAKRESQAGGQFIGLDGRPNGLRSAFNLVRELRKIGSRETRVLGFGYEPMLVIALAVARFSGARVFSIVFDSHVGATRKYRWPRRLLLDIYFNGGKLLLRCLNGVFVVTDAAREAIRPFNRNVFRTRIGGQVAEEPTWVPPDSPQFKILYAGALEPYNLLEEICDGIGEYSRSNLRSRPVQLEIYGEGSLRTLVQDRAKCLDFVSYHGVVQRPKIDAIASKTNLALCLRDLDDPVTKFAFPSKLLELLSIGIPVLTTQVLPAEVLSNHAEVIRDVSPKGIACAIQRVIANYDEITELAATGPSFVTTYFNQTEVVAEMVGFIETTVGETGGSHQKRKRAQ